MRDSARWQEIHHILASSCLALPFSASFRLCKVSKLSYAG